jgi:hypothetical protein
LLHCTKKNKIRAKLSVFGNDQECIMQRFTTFAIGGAVALCAMLAHADAKPLAAQAISASPNALTPAKAQRGDMIGSMLQTSDAPISRTSIGARTPGDNTNTFGMLAGALAIMGVMARRRWRSQR